ncbi:30S ribosomal protein S1 [Psittacicella hinzii]
MENFAQLFEASILNTPKVGEVVEGTVIGFQKGFVIVDAGLKSEAQIDAEEFKNANGELTVKVGDKIEVAVESLENGQGDVTLSRKKAKTLQVWKKLQEIHDNKETITGHVSSKVKGGYTVEIDGIRAFLPGSLVELRPSRDNANIEGKDLEFKVIKLDQKRNNIVVSRRAVLENEDNADREALIETLEEGKVVKGTIKNLTDYGAFVDLGGVDGLLHITDMSWKRVKHPSEVVAVGEQVEVVVLKFDKEKVRVSLGLKQLQADPWEEVVAKYQVGDKLTGKVTNLAEYGCFVEILGGIEGLVHVSEMDWTNKNVHPSKVVSLGEEVQVQILEIDEVRRRISLGIKQCKENPWAKFAETYSRGQKVTGKIKSITDFGIFIGLEGGIDGLVHVSDLGNGSNEELVRQYKKGDEVTAVVLQIDAEKERISLGIKQLNEEELNSFVAAQNSEQPVKAVVVAKEDTKVKVKVEDKFDGFVNASELETANVGDSLELYVLGVDRKNTALNLSVAPRADKVKEEEVKNTAFADALAQAQNQ